MFGFKKDKSEKKDQKIEKKIEQKKESSFSSKIKELFSKKKFSEEFYEDLEELLISADVGAIATSEIISSLQAEVKSKKIDSEEEVITALKEILLACVKETTLELESDKLNLFIVLGVNGVGKTTSIAKMANFYKNGNNIILAAADTFRAAAIDQLQIHGKNLNIPVVAHCDGGDPAAVVYDAIQSAVAKNAPLVLADTAGRMHNKTNLIAELQKITKVTQKFNVQIALKKILVLDATTGQNGVAQAEIFNDAVGIDAIILSKYDSLSKGGIVITLGKKLGLPVAFVGVGEKYENILPFSKQSFIDKIMEN